MAKLKSYNYNQAALVAMDLEKQPPLGSLEFAIHYLFDHKIDLSGLESRFRNDSAGQPAYYDPHILLKVILHAYSRGMIRSLKTTLKLRPNYHSKDEHIRCHIFVCFLSLLLIRIVENQTGKTWRSVRDEMSHHYFGEFDHNGSVRLLTELTKEQRTILQAMNIRSIYSDRHTPISNL